MTKHHMPIFVINLESQRERRSNVLRQFKDSSLKPTLVTAFDGHDPKFPFPRYRHLAGRFWESESDFKPGAFCCYLSHAQCWREIAAGNAELGLVLEDDVEINVQALADFSVENPKELDLVFVNQRTSNYLKYLPAVAEDRVGMGDLITRLIVNGTFAKRIPVPGADGYVVSKSGAEKLLRMMGTRGICMGVDYALVLNSLDAGQIETLSGIDSANLPFSTRCFLANETRISTGPIGLDSFIHTGTPLVALGRFKSTIRHEVRRSNQAFDPDPGR
ncbi:MAG: glycosyltransferase family 25 protein [Rhodospirillaceae bacterium]|nr:glycosyltransferase family 25 protein [Rhodospirillaceae bacterium]